MMNITEGLSFCKLIFPLLQYHPSVPFLLLSSIKRTFAHLATGPLCACLHRAQLSGSG